MNRITGSTVGRAWRFAKAAWAGALVLGAAAAGAPAAAAAVYNAGVGYGVVVQASSDAGTPVSFGGVPTVLTHDLSGSGVHAESAFGTQWKSYANGLGKGYFESSLQLGGSAGNGQDGGASAGAHDAWSTLDVDFGGGGGSLAFSLVGIGQDPAYFYAAADTDVAGEQAWAKLEIMLLWHWVLDGYDTTTEVFSAVLDTGTVFGGDGLNLGLGSPTLQSLSVSGPGQLLLRTRLSGAASASGRLDGGDVPEPATPLLAALGLVAMAVSGRRRRSVAR